MSLLNHIEKIIWVEPENPRSPGIKTAVRTMRVTLTLLRDFAGVQLTLRAMGLVYTTLLSIIPLLALSFFVLKTFGVYGQIEPVLLNFFSPLGEIGEEFAHKIVQFIEKVNVGVLGTLGLVLLVYTAVSLMQKIEESLNYIWHIPRPRPFGERFSRYLSALLVGPILVFTALGITARVMNIELVHHILAIDGLNQTMQIASRLMPYLLVIMAFTLSYMFIPNTRVRFGPALLGGVAGGIIWQTAGWAFAAFAVSSKNYAAIYSSLALLIVFMVWLYLSWLILLFGASVAFYVQHPEYLYPKGGEPRLSNRMRERLGLSVMSLVVSKFIAGERSPSLPELAGLLAVPMHALEVIFLALESKKLVVQSNDDPPIYLLARDPSLITIVQVLDTVRAAGEENFLSPDGQPAPQFVDEVLDRARQAVKSSVGDMTLRDLVTKNQGDTNSKSVTH